MKQCSRCGTKLKHIGTISPGMMGQVSTYIYYCPKDGILEQQDDWTSKPREVLIPEILTDYPDEITEDRAMIHQIIETMLDHPDKSGIYSTSKCYNELEELLKKVRIKAVGWAWAEACIKLDNNFDPRQHDQAILIKEALKDLNKKEN